MTYQDRRASENQEIRDSIDESRNEFDSRILWVLIPIAVGGGVSMFSNFQQDIQIIIWAVMFIIGGAGVWTVNARKLRKKRERHEDQRGDDFEAKLDEKFDNINERFDSVNARFDEVDRRFDVSEASDKTLLRNEIIKMHREYCQTKGYIILQALEYVDRLHDQYNAVHGNDTGDKLWEEMHKLPVYDSEAVVPPEVRAKGADLCMATGKPYQTMHPGAMNG